MHPTLRRAHLAIVPLLLVLAACRPASTGESASASATNAPATSPSASVDASASASPSEEPTGSAPAEPSTSAGAQASGFAVLPNPEADSLFLYRDDCENSEDGYRLEFPEEWYTNTEIGDVPACSWFSPTFYEADDSGAIPSEIAITIDILDGDRGYHDDFISNDEVVIGTTQDAHRVEVESDGTTMYEYVVQLGPSPEEGPNLLARTDTDMGGDYELNKAVLDRIMATMEFIGTIQ
jgi:hypothetical protein